MKFFSQQTDTEEKNDASREIPAEIRRAVRVMAGNTNETVSEKQHTTVEPSVKAAVPSRPSPFLSGETEEQPVVEAVKPVSHEPVSLAPVWNSPATAQLKPLFDDPLTVPAPLWKQKKVWIVLSLIGVALFGVALWWYFFRKTTTSVVVPSPIVESVAPGVGLVAMPELPYSPVSPNYLAVDVETITPASLKDLLRQPEERILAANMAQPVEFMLTDKNNNPLAFSRFAYLMKLDLNPELVAVLGESFSLFLHNENGRFSLGLQLSLETVPGKDPMKLQKETLLPRAFETVLFDGVTLPRETVFRSGTYNGQAVRYVNIDTAKNISFDYAIRNTEWLIGTSKDTLRAILDKK